MNCNRLSVGALLLTFAVSFGGLALAYRATVSTVSRAFDDHNALAQTLVSRAPTTVTLPGARS